MTIQQTNATNGYESAVGSLLAALAQGASGQGAAAAFQTQLASSLNAVSPQVPARAETQPVASGKPHKAKVRPAKTDDSNAAGGAVSQDQPQASAAAGSNGATVSQDNSSNAQVSPENKSSANQGGTTSTATATETTSSTATTTVPTTTATTITATPSATATVTVAAPATTTATTSPGSAGGLIDNGSNNGLPQADAAPASGAADAESAVTAASGKSGRGTGAQKTAKDQSQTASAPASTETTVPTNQTGSDAGRTQAAVVATLGGPSEAVGAKAQTTPQAGAEITNAATPPIGSSSGHSSSTAQPAAQQDAARASAAKTVDFQQALQGLSLQSMTVRAEMAGGQVAAAAAYDSATSAGGDATAIAAVGMSGSQSSTPAAQAEADVQTGTAEQPDQAAQVEQIVRAMQSSLSRGGGRVTLQLSPPELGRLRVQMQIRGSDLTASFDTENEAAQTLLQNSLPQLRQALASQGLRLVDASVQIQGGAAHQLGGQSGGSSGAGNFGPGTQTGGRQTASGGQQHYGQAVETEPAATAPWNTVVEDDSRVNVVV